MELRTVHTPTGGSSREFSAMGESLTEQWCVSDEGLWIVKLFYWGRKTRLGNESKLTVPIE